jgi:membrane-associated phospholipid phosphatase
VTQLGKGLLAAPRNAAQSDNLMWEFPVLSATGVLIGAADNAASDRIQSASLQRTANNWSNIGLGLELGAGAITYGIGCTTHRAKMREVGQTALDATGAASLAGGVMKLGFGRLRPRAPNGGEFWSGGNSFPSGHAAASFAFASVIAHRYPHNPWLKWTAYGVATGVSLARFPAKEHFLSDIVIGGTIGYVTGAYLASPR